MTIKFARLISVVSLLFLSGCAASAADADEWTFNGVERVVAISDVHGAYDAMVDTLQKAGVIDESLAWSGGATHLVITGDLLDRGPDSRPVMDLIMALESQSAEAGGRVHQLLGNHEVMNLAGDLRYVADAEYASFADDESAEEREAWFKKFAESKGAAENPESVRAEFDKVAPPGFFGHRRAFRADGKYGSWMLGLPLVVVINGTAFVHGGLSTYTAEVGLEGYNKTLMTELGRYVKALNRLEDAGVMTPFAAFYDHPSLLEPKLENGVLTEGLADAARDVIKLNESRIHGLEGPLWYRGNVGCSVLIEGDTLDAALTEIGANRVVIGHTPTVDRHVLQRLDGRVIMIDTGMLNKYYRGSGNALILEGDSLSVMNQNGELSAPAEQPRAVGSRPAGISREQILAALESGNIIEMTEHESGRDLVSIDVNGTQISAWFDKRPRKKGFYPELAAYKLDLLLGLDMIPATVRREVDGDDGTLQYFPSKVRTEEQRSASGRGGSAWCPLQQQWNSMYLFDALSDNPGRSIAYMMYNPDNWSLFLVNNQKSFGNGKGRPAYLKEAPLTIGAHWASALEGLDEATLEAELGDVLDRKQRSALGKRRDALLKEIGR